LDQKNLALKSPNDRIEEDKIILDGQGKFPKKVIIYMYGKIREYQLFKTRNDGFILR